MTEKRRLRSRLEALLARLLQWQLQPGGRSGRWKARIAIRRSCVAEILDDSPSLRSTLAAVIAGSWRIAVLRAVRRTKLDKSGMPATCPWTIEQIFDERFYPGGRPEMSRDEED